MITLTKAFSTTSSITSEIVAYGVNIYSHTLHRFRLKWLLTIMCVTLFSWSNPAFSTEDKTLLEIRKNPNDSLEYRSVTLENGLVVFLIHDAKTQKAAASLSVGVGSGSDPKDREGLAHFLEHMLFLGTEKYPDSGEYSSFITSHGGYNNAFTSFSETNYYFDIDAKYLEPAIDRFAQFFISPLFEEDLVEREKNAVHSEFSGKRREDTRRIWAARRQAFNPEHPISSFSTGTLETLADRGDSKIRDELITFYEQYYSANIMTLAIYGSETLDELESMARSKFAAIPNRNSTLQVFDLPLFKPSDLPRRLDVQTLEDKRTLTMTFELDYTPSHTKTKPYHIISHFLGDEAKGSLLSALKSRDYADYLHSGGSMSKQGMSIYRVSMTLTPTGLKNIDEIVEMVFATIELAKREGVKKWYFEEYKQLTDIDLQFKEKKEPSSVVTSVAGLLHEWPAKDVLIGPYEVTEFDPAHMRDTLQQLTPQRLMLTVASPDVESEQLTRFFETPYTISPIDKVLVDRWSKVGPMEEINLPDRNPFIPSSLELVEEENNEIPVQIKKLAGVELWHKTDKSFDAPKANFYVSLQSKVANSSARNTVLTKLFVRLVKEQLNEFTYPATLAGLEYSLYRHTRGITLRVEGYSDKQEVILTQILDVIKNPDFSHIYVSCCRSLTGVMKHKSPQQKASLLKTLMHMPPN